MNITEGLLDFTYASQGTAAHLVRSIKVQLQSATTKCNYKVWTEGKKCERTCL